MRLRTFLLSEPRFHLSLIVGWIFLIYAPAFKSSFLRYDDLIAVGQVRAQSFWAVLTTTSWAGSHLYRPVFATKMWLLEQMFGINFAGSLAVHLLLLCLAAAIFYVGFVRLSRSSCFALLLVLLGISHPFLSPLVLWLSDAAVIQFIGAGLLLLLLTQWKFALTNYLALFFLVLLMALSRENGLAFFPALVVYFSILLIRRSISGRQWLWVGGAAAGSILIYFMARSLTVTALPAQLPGDQGGFFLQTVSPAELAAFTTAERLVFSAYTVGANLLTTFIPVVDGVGTLGINSFYITVFALACFLAILAFTWLYSHTPIAPSLNRLNLFLGAIILGAIIFYLAPWPSHELLGVDMRFLGNIIRAGMHGVLSLIILFNYLQWRTLSTKQLAMSGAALTLIFAGSTLAFVYFRTRNLYIGLFGWLILLALAGSYLPSLKSGNSLTAITRSAVIILIFANSVLLYQSLPENYAQGDNPQSVVNALCNPDIPPGLVSEVRTYYDLQFAPLTDCPATGR